MLRLLREIWPAILPLLLYAGWMVRQRKKARSRGESLPKLVEGPWFWAVIASIVIAIACLFFLGLSEESVKGRYVPPHMENGRLVPGRISQ